jgi:PIN domain nuclease of toxin-antitoxin system
VRGHLAFPPEPAAPRKRLLDTHQLFFIVSATTEIFTETRQKLQDPSNLVFVSTVSAWEMDIKRALGKLRAPADLAEQVRQRRFTELPLHLRHVRALRDLPAIHRDPFDRMLIAQARSDGLVLVSRDARVQRYPVDCVRA